MALRSTLTPSIPVAHETPKVAEQSTQGDRGWAVRGGSTPARAFRRPHRAHRRTNSPTKCESSTNTSNATGSGVQTLVAATIEMSSMRGRSGIGLRTPCFVRLRSSDWLGRRRARSSQSARPAVRRAGDSVVAEAKARRDHRPKMKGVVGLLDRWRVLLSDTGRAPTALRGWPDCSFRSQAHERSRRSARSLARASVRYRSRSDGLARMAGLLHDIFRSQALARSGTPATQEQAPARPRPRRCSDRDQGPTARNRGSAVRSRSASWLAPSWSRRAQPGYSQIACSPSVDSAAVASVWTGAAGSVMVAVRG